MKEILSTITSKGQVTIRTEVRKHLGLRRGDKISFVIEDAGRVELKAPTCPTVASLAGVAGSLQHPLSTEKMMEMAREDELEDEYRSTV